MRGPPNAGACICNAPENRAERRRYDRLAHSRSRDQAAVARTLAVWSATLAPQRALGHAAASPGASAGFLAGIAVGWPTGSMCPDRRPLICRARQLRAPAMVKATVHGLISGFFSRSPLPHHRPDAAAVSSAAAAVSRAAVRRGKGAETGSLGTGSTTTQSSNFDRFPLSGNGRAFSNCWRTKAPDSDQESLEESVSARSRGFPPFPSLWTSKMMRRTPTSVSHPPSS